MKHTRVLLLSHLYLPLRVIPWHAAIKLKYEDLVDVLAEYDEEIKSPSVTWKIPAVVRLKNKKGQRGKAVKFSPRGVFIRDGYECQYCGRAVVKTDNHRRRDAATIDHVTPKSHGGPKNYTNTVTACVTCNLKKGSKTCDEAGMFPRNPPRAPRMAPNALPYDDRKNVPAEWEPWVVDV